MQSLRLAVIGTVSLLSACGLRVPDIQESGGKVEQLRFVQAVLTNITCELRNAVADIRDAQGPTFIDTWGVQTTLTLTYDEKSALNPGALLTPNPGGSSFFTLGAGLNWSSQAARTNTINAYYLVSELQQGRCSAEARENGPYLLQNDLKLSEWLNTAVLASKTNSIDFGRTTRVVKENVIQHQVKFDVVTGGSATPTWTLVEATVNPEGPFFSTNRSRTNDLLITFAPAAEVVVAEVNKNGRRRVTVVAQPSRQGADLHFSANVASSIETGIRNATQR